MRAILDRQGPWKWLLLAAVASIALVPVRVLLPGLALEVAGRIFGAMPLDAHIYYQDEMTGQWWPPRLEVACGWHTCSRGLEDFEEGAFVLDLLTGWARSDAPLQGSRDWASVIGCADTGTVTFDARVVEFEELLYVEVPGGDEDGGATIVEVKIPYDTMLLDESGDPVHYEDFIERLSESTRVRIEVEDIGGDAWSTRIQLLER